MRPQLRTLAACLITASVLIGCGGLNDAPETAEVSGIVKLDGQPLAKATVSFQAGNKRPSFGITDDQGKYTLSFSQSQSGAAIGENLVKISSDVPEGEYSDKENKTDPKIPAKYNSEAQTNPDMKKEVKAGSNEINFDLKSKE